MQGCLALLVLPLSVAAMLEEALRAEGEIGDAWEQHTALAVGLP